ncbi:MAG: lysozyme [bacterium]|jgi:lysozyme
MTLNDKGYQLIAKHEGLRLSPYLCPANVPTIGYGNTFYPSGKKVTMQDKPITQATAMWMLKETANKFATDVDRLVTSNITQNQFNALVSFAFNLGSAALGRSTLLRKVNLNPKDPSITQEFMKWNKAGGRVLSGLTKRRAEEASLYFTP